MNAPCNIAAALPRLAAERPDQVALRCPGTRGPDGLARYDVELTYAALDRRSDAIAAGLARHGITRGTRTVVMVRPSPEFFLLMFALFKAGAVPVLVDPGIDKRALRQCLDEAQPQAFIGIPLAHLARRLLGWAKAAAVLITTGRRPWLADVTLAAVEQAGDGAGPQLADTAPDDVAAILFTSGSTGVPKGVVYRHRHFVAQIELLGRAFGLQAGGVDLPTFPPFALFDPALGLTSVIPDMDPTRPANADPRRLHDAIARFGVDQLFGSPALVAVLARHGQPLPTLRRVTSAGAPVPPDTVAALRALLPADAQFWTPYGATECLPVAVVEGGELQATRAATEAGAGTCVGRPVPPNEVRIIAITDDAIAEWDQARVLGVGEVGEITVAGPTTTDTYFNREAQTRQAKIRERLMETAASGESVAPVATGFAATIASTEGEAESPGGARERIVHRMGDVGYFDAEGRLWFCGRKSHRVETLDGPLYTEQVEPAFNVHPQVRRTALVGVAMGNTRPRYPVLCVELAEGIPVREWPRIERELRDLAARHPHTARISRFLRHKRFPVDIRHNAKIGREKLAVWAAQQGVNA
ncbi:fatty acid CoA ligase family protein [Aerolutibacter ruishenii]|uniref:Acyl-CoA synthetase (AMP-forming)/AMP-acid ligase II n=1 Tax=Aerolutibacter ruishenii TaxID=686800 RepID=A0A562M0Y5_9GAMM|nr:fatty acid CoA ligase family protein [Lysobacter ruishenii]TWI13605.1 acyl-CoA synthetase (AMP-forming)/AMP-acid ligase II [Lysobacter ruishenii]